MKRFLTHRFKVYALVVMFFLAANIADYITWGVDNAAQIGIFEPSPDGKITMKGIFPKAEAAALQNGVDPCGLAGLTTTRDISATADTIAATGTTGSTLYICAIDVVVDMQTASSARLITGTGSACATATYGLTGAYPTTNGLTQVRFKEEKTGRTHWRSNSGADVCIDITSGAALTIRGFIDYVLRPN